MAELRNCTKCGRLYGYMGKNICSYCMDEEEDEFKKVKDYLYDYPGSTIFEVSDATGVSEEKILKFLRDERLLISSENNNLILECENCGRSINMGRFCQRCKEDLQNSIRKEFGMDKPKGWPENVSKEKDKMFTATRRK